MPFTGTQSFKLFFNDGLRKKQEKNQTMELGLKQ